MDFLATGGRQTLFGDDGYDAMAGGSPGINGKGQKEPRSDEWMAFAVAEAEDEWRRRNARERRNLR